MVREPVEMFVSRFRYARLPHHYGYSRRYMRGGKVGGEDEAEWLVKDISTCVLSGDPECAHTWGEPGDLPIAYLCGQEPFCRMVGNRAALALAKKNIEEFYPVVGVLEKLDQTLALLEHSLPAQFGGVTNLYYNQLKEPHRNRNRRKNNGLTRAARAKLNERLALEKELYEWVRARLERQFSQLDRQQLQA